MIHSIVNVTHSALAHCVCVTQISANTSNYVHFANIFISAIFTMPNKFTIFVAYHVYWSSTTTYMTPIKSSINFSIHDFIIHVLNYRQDSFNIVFHIWSFNVRDCTTWRQRLKLWFNVNLLESINFFKYRNVIRVSYVVSVSNARNNTKSTL